MRSRATDPPEGQETGLSALHRDVSGVVRHTTQLAEAELRLAVAKGKEGIAAQIRGVAKTLVAWVLACVGGIYLCYALYAGLQKWLDPWAAALVMAGALFTVSLLLLIANTKNKKSRNDFVSLDAPLGEDPVAKERR